MKTLKLLLPLILLSSCGLLKKCPEVYLTDSVKTTIVYHDTIIQGNMVFDTLTEETIKYLPKYKTVVKRDTSGLVELRYYKDAYGQLIVDCEAKDKKLKTVQKTLENTKTRVVIETKEKIPWWIWLIVGGLGIAFFAVLFKK